LLSYNESLSFIIFWSILEEISKGYTKVSDTWDSKFERSLNWKFKNGEYFILFDNNEMFINFGRNDNGDYIKKSFVFSDESIEFKKYSKNSIINLSDLNFNSVTTNLNGAVNITITSGLWRGTNSSSWDNAAN
jgi:hypothetical protein